MDAIKALTEVLLEGTQEGGEDAVAAPDTEEAVDSLVGRKAGSKVVPGDVGGELEEDGIEDQAVGDGRATGG